MELTKIINCKMFVAVPTPEDDSLSCASCQLRDECLSEINDCDGGCDCGIGRVYMELNKDPIVHICRNCADINGMDDSELNTNLMVGVCQSCNAESMVMIVL